MAAFVGKWKQDEIDVKKCTDFLKAAGMSEDTAEKYFNNPTILEIRLDGNKWTMILTMNTEPILSKTYEFIPGELYEFTDFRDRKFKLRTEVVSDTKIKQTYLEWSKFPISTVREVQDDKIINTFNCEGAEMEVTFSRITV